jgi:hypothetical protein
VSLIHILQEAAVPFQEQLSVFFKSMFSEWKKCGMIRSSGGVDHPRE